VCSTEKNCVLVTDNCDIKPPSATKVQNTRKQSNHSYTTLAEDLASHGYVVVGFDSRASDGARNVAPISFPNSAAF
jgi:hypothetical protein